MFYTLFHVSKPLFKPSMEKLQKDKIYESYVKTRSRLKDIYLQSRNEENNVNYKKSAELLFQPPQKNETKMFLQPQNERPN